MLGCVGISIDDVVFRTHKYTRRTVKSLGRCELTTWDLDKEVRLGIRGLTPLSYDMIEAQIKFVVG